MRMQANKSVSEAVAFFILLPLLFSCSTFGKSVKNDEGFVTAVQNLNSAIRWQDYKTAASLISPPLRSDFWNLSDELQKSVRIMDFEIRHSVFNELSLSGEATLRYRYYYTDSPKIQTKTLHQQYRFSEKEEIWLLVRHDLDLLLP